MRSASSSPIRLNVASEQLAVVATSLRLHLIWVFLVYLAVLLFRMSRPAVMCVPQISQQVSGSFPSWTTATLNLKWQNMKCWCSLPALCATFGNPGTRNLTSCSIDVWYNHTTLYLKCYLKNNDCILALVMFYETIH